ncbi:hypothetical protein [Cellulosimicrobium marinum]|uniref:hypothetical protein n=1 Tax=Cellulosimicrobium marinum TaxID=1638992 RepID=UPI001E2D92CC|nr:hypothetical protein [Cellulosimicrobium marinum]MCB7137302.1 hypothetical protein [Cellulosimicrobium marinum]
MPDANEERSVLELRIHGVANTPPHGMLDLPPDEVDRCDGDGLGSFWTATAEADARDRAPGTAEHPVAPGDLHAVRPDVRREAYSWGGMARHGGLPLAGALGAVARGANRALWALNVPFGLANVAYWARRVPGAEDSADRAAPVAAPPGRCDDETVERARPEAAAAAVRVFGLALTLLLAAALTTVAVATLGTRCMGVVDPDATTVQVCARVPDVLDGLARTDHGNRVAILSALPVVVVLALVLLARSGQVRFDERVSIARAGQRQVGAGTGPLLYRAGFWSRRVAGPAPLLAHLAAALGLVGVLLAWTDDRPAAGTAVLVVGAAAVVLGAVVVALRSDDRGVQAEPPGWKSALAVAALVLGCAAWVGAMVVSARRVPGTALPAYVGIDVAPTVLGGVLVGIAAAGLVWRRQVPAVLWSLVPLVVTGCLVVVAVVTTPETVDVVLVAVAAAVLLVPLVPTLPGVVRPGAGGSDRWVGWSGAGPGVFLLLATATAAVLTSLLVLGTQLLLTGGRDARPAAEGALVVDIVRTVPGPEDLPVPSAYTEFGASAIVLVVVALGGLVMLAGPGLHDLVRTWTRWIPRAAGTTADLAGPTGWAARTLQEAEARRTPGTRQRIADIPLAARRTVRARQVAAVTHRAEPAVGVLALAAWAALVLALLARDDAASVAGVPGLSLRGLDPVAVPFVGGLALALVASFVAAGANGAARPWGLLWDLMCFLPRSAHPFGPPCYAERVVPEVAARVDAWLDAEDVPVGPAREAAAPRRRVVLSAHSLGAVVAVAVVLGRAGNPSPVPDDAAPPPRTDGDGRVGLLTYGVQLRPYFGRFFPSLLGPQVLGTPACAGPAGRGDPWRDQTDDPRRAVRAAARAVPPDDATGAPARERAASYEERRRDALRRDADVRAARARVRHAIARDAADDHVDALRDQVRRAEAELAAALAPLAEAEAQVADEAATRRRALDEDADRAEQDYRAARSALVHARRADPRHRAELTLDATAHRRAADTAWARARCGPGASVLPPSTPTLVRLLRHAEHGPAWVNLWRRTDYLGFPVVSYGTNPVDRGADEVDRGAYLFTVATHSGYYRAWAYHEGLDTVLRRLGVPTPRPTPPPPPEDGPRTDARATAGTGGPAGRGQSTP